MHASFELFLGNLSDLVCFTIRGPDTNHTSATGATRMQHDCETSATLATRLQHKCDTSVTQVRHKCYTNDTSATRVKNFNFDNDTGKNIFSHLYIYYMASERLRGEEQFHTKNYLLEISRFHAKMRLKTTTTKIKLSNGKSFIKKLYTRV